MTQKKKIVKAEGEKRGIQPKAVLTKPPIAKPPLANITKAQPAATVPATSDKKAVKKIKGLLLLIGCLLLFGSGFLYLLKIQDNPLALHITDADKASFTVVKTGDSLRTPINTYPDPGFNAMGLLNFFRQVSIKNTTLHPSGDTTHFLITAGGVGNPTSISSYRFSATLYLFDQKDLYNVDDDSLLIKDEDLKKLHISKSIDLKNLYFLSLINNGRVKIRNLSPDCVSALIPENEVRLTISKNKERNVDTINSLTVNYHADYKKIAQVGYNPYYEIFGSRIALLSDDVIVLLGNKGTLLTDVKSVFKRDEYAGKACLLIFQIPYTFRIHISDWDNGMNNQWEKEMLFNRYKDSLHMFSMFHHIPMWIDYFDQHKRRSVVDSVLYSSTLKTSKEMSNETVPFSNWYKKNRVNYEHMQLYMAYRYINFMLDSNAQYTAPPYVQSKYNIDFTLEYPITNSQFLQYKNKYNAGKTVYSGDVDHPVPGQIDHWVS